MAITAYLLYRDAGAAVDWLEEVFGLSRDEVLTGADGRVREGGPGRPVAGGDAA